MNDIIIKRYCLVGFGNISNLTTVIGEISEDGINYVKGQGVSILIFNSTLTTKDIEFLLKTEGYNFIITEIVPSLFGADMGHLHNELFNESRPSKVEEGSFEEETPSLNDLLDMISKNGLESLNVKYKKLLDTYSKK